MLVDPATGMPIDNPGGTMGANATMSGLNQIGYTQEDIPLAFDVLANIPGVVTTSAWNMNRVSNTMIKGGRRQRRAMRLGSNIGTGPTTFNALNQTFNPFRFFRMSRARMIDPAVMYGGTLPKKNESMYSPFGIATRAGNFATRQIVSRSKWAAGMAAKVGYGPKEMNAGVAAFSRGTFGRMAAMANIGAMSEKQLAKRAGTITASVVDLEGGTIDLSGRRSPFPSFDVTDLTHAQAQSRYIARVGNTIKTPFSGQIAGYMQGAQRARVGVEAAQQLLDDATGNFAKGAAKGVAAFNKGGMLAKFAGGRAASMALRAAGPVGTMFLIRDIAMITGKLVGAAGKTIIDAGKSLMAPLNKGVMGAQFRDNAVAATSRQRGVMAIANSRLNMRSVLGHEAAGMAAYYG